MTTRTITKHFGKPNWFIKKSNYTHLPVEVGYRLSDSGQAVRLLDFLKESKTPFKWSSKEGVLFFWVEVSR